MIARRFQSNFDWDVGPVLSLTVCGGVKELVVGTERSTAGLASMTPVSRLRVAKLAALLAAVVVSGRPARADSIAPLGDAQALNAPQAVDGTFAVGVSNGNVVGGYYSAANLNHGFLYNGNSFSPLDFPGSTTTMTSGISGQNIVGFYTDASNATHGFLYNGQAWTPLDDPNGNNTVAAGVSGNRIVGYFRDGTTTQGFLYDPANSPNPFITLSDPTPGAQSTVAYGIDGSEIVGYFMAGNHVHGFSYIDGAYTTLDFPGSISTAAYGVSGGNIVGSYQDANGIYHGFLYNGTDWTALNVALPGATSTQAYGISGNQVVGEYIDTSLVNHGFIATLPVPGPSSIVLLVSGALTAVALMRRRRGPPYRQLPNCI